MRRRAVLLLALLAPLAVSTGASAAPVSKASVRLAGCDSAARTADFEADMRAVPGAVRLQLRFTLQVREEDHWARVPAPAIDHWLAAGPGRTRWVYDKRVQNLPVGASRAQVRFRWRDAAGEVLRTATRRSRPCRVPDPRPDLVPVDVGTGAGPTADTRTYAVIVVNAGRGDAPAFDVSLAVAGMPVGEAVVGPLPAGSRLSVSFVGPACPPGGVLAAGVDTAGVVDEAREADDVLTIPCDTA